jgi:hypothetical protein
MKVFRTSIICLALLLTSHLKSQNCSEAYYVSKVGTKLTYETKDEKGKLITTQESTVKSVKNTTDGTEIGLSATTKDGKGKVIMESMDFSVTCSNGIIKLRFSDMMMASMSRMKDMEMEMIGDGIHYPSDLKEGQELPNGETEIKIKTSGMTLMTMRQKEISRKVEKKESITTSAGTFECFKIISESEMKMMVKRTSKTAVWFAKGVGMVKMESYNKKNEVEMSMLLTKLEK